MHGSRAGRTGNTSVMPVTFDVVRPFQLDPDLLDGLDERTALHLQHRAVAQRIRLRPGRWIPAGEVTEPRGHLGLLVLDGVLVRTVTLAGRRCSEILGPGDVLRPWEDDTVGTVESTAEWLVIEPITMAALDARVAAQLTPWPVVLANIMARGTRRSRALVHQAAIARVRHAETRVLLLLWQLADRWGKVTPDGVVVPVPLTHRLVAELTCLQRPTVSSAFGHLAREGHIERRDDGGWLLHGEPPSGSLPGAALAVA